MINNYRENDKLYFFGFSRGAYSVRSLAGLIGVCGIPQPQPNDMDAMLATSQKIYCNRNYKKQKELSEFWNRYKPFQADIHFVGVWDTVGALGVPTAGPLGWWTRYRSGFHDVTLGFHIKHAYHAVAINERRGLFKPTLWDQKKLTNSQTVEQAWFPGVHSNIGGGYVDSGLSDRALLWIIYNANDCGLCFDEGYIDLYVRPNWFGELRDSIGLKYKLMFWNRPRDRSIGTVSPKTENLHISVDGRWKHVTRPEKKPLNLVNAPQSMPLSGSKWEESFNLANRTNLIQHQGN